MILDLNEIDGVNALEKDEQFIQIQNKWLKVIKNKPEIMEFYEEIAKYFDQDVGEPGN